MPTYIVNKFWICNYCKQEYGKEYLALNCEENHIKKEDITIFQVSGYKPEKGFGSEYITGQLPMIICVKDKSGYLHYYQYQGQGQGQGQGKGDE